MIASSANTEQCILTGGRANSSAISEFFIKDACEAIESLILQGSDATMNTYN